MDIAQALKDAVAAVEAAGVPEDLRRDAFRAVLASYGIPSDVKVPTGDEKKTRQEPTKQRRDISDKGSDTGGAEVEPNEFFAKFAHESGINRDWLELVYFVKDGKPGIATSQRRLGEHKVDQTKSVALLLTAAYHFGMDLVEVDTQIVRAECQRLKCLDGPNFAKTIKQAEGVSVTGAPRSKVLKFKQVALPKLDDLIKHSAGAEEN